MKGLDASPVRRNRIEEGALKKESIMKLGASGVSGKGSWPFTMGSPQKVDFKEEKNTSVALEEKMKRTHSGSMQ